jgi:hypothetical protein
MHPHAKTVRPEDVSIPAAPSLLVAPAVDRPGRRRGGAGGGAAAGARRGVLRVVPGGLPVLPEPGSGRAVLRPVQHATRAGWSVVVRRLAEHVAAPCRCSLLFVPVALGRHALYHWTHEETVAADPILLPEAGVPQRGLLLRPGGRVPRDLDALVLVVPPRVAAPGPRGGDPADHAAHAVGVGTGAAALRAHPRPSPPSTGSCRSTRTGTRPSSASTTSPARWWGSSRVLALPKHGAVRLSAGGRCSPGGDRSSTTTTWASCCSPSSCSGPTSPSPSSC